MILNYLHLKVQTYCTLTKQYDMPREILGEINVFYFVTLPDLVKEDISSWCFEQDVLGKAGAAVGLLLHRNLNFSGKIAGQDGSVWRAEEKRINY